MTTRTERTSSDSGATAQHPVVVFLAALLPIVGLAFPLIGSGPNIGRAVPYAVIGAVLGLAIGFLLLRLCRETIGTPTMIVALFIAMFVFRRLDGGWPLATPPYFLSSFAGAIIGSVLRFRAWKPRIR